MEYKFRGKALNRNDTWFFGDVRHGKNGEVWVFPLDEDPGIDKHRVHPDSIGMWTGLKDMDEVEVDWWEGDILKHSSPDVRKDCCFYIVYEQGCFFAKGIGGFFYEPPVHHILWAERDIEKIGNTTDNENLLENKKELKEQE